ILTPHPGEFDRLAGKSKNGFERIEKARELAKKHHIYLVLKGANTAVCTPRGYVWFNSTGNPGMATAGSGDVLTGIIAGMLAQHMKPFDAACLGVFIHGLAGDEAADEIGEEALIASDITDFLPEAYDLLADE
ncbi:MAG: NAD(P)H-hydrate dehydratase, partial [Bacteroidota bacterium]